MARVKFPWAAGAIAALLPSVVLAQVNFDTSGTALLEGAYFFRQVYYGSLSSVDQIGESASVIATVTFDGAGNYRLSGQVSDNTVSSGAPQPLSTTGTYGVNASGLFYMDNPLTTDEIFGGVGQSAIVGSSTENSNGYFDFMVAVPIASSATNASLSGTYRMVAMDYPNGDVTQVNNSTFLINPNGAGNLGPITVSGHAVNVSDANFTFNQPITGATYSLSTGAGTMTFPAQSSGASLISGTKQFFVSADGNILVAGSLTGYDIEVGIKVSGSSASSNFSGTYFSGGEDYDASSFASSGYYYLDSFYGSANVVSSGGNTTVLYHQRLNPDNNDTHDYTADDEFSLSNGIASETYYQYFTGAGGTARIVTGQSTEYSIELDVLAQSLRASGAVSLSPLGVVGTANYVPITNPVTPGEFVTLFGAGLAPSPATAALPFPTALNGVSVSINGLAAPVYYVSSNEIVCIVPFELDLADDGYAVFQVTNNNVVSNAVTLFTEYSAPGVFTQDQSGTGPAAALHRDGSLVTAGNPAQMGETIAVYVTGLGTVTPAVADGVAAPSTPLSNADENIDVFVDGQPATVAFKGLAPTFAGLYQMDFVVPNIAPDSGAVFLDLSDKTMDILINYNSMATLYVAGSSGDYRHSAARPTRRGHVARNAIRRSNAQLRARDLASPAMAH